MKTLLLLSILLATPWLYAAQPAPTYLRLENPRLIEAAWEQKMLVYSNNIPNHFVTGYGGKDITKPEIVFDPIFML